MPSLFSNALRIELIATGEQAGSWGITNNRNLGTLLEQAIAGFKIVPMVDANKTLLASNGLEDEARSAALEFTGSLTAQRSVILPASPKQYNIKNSTNQPLLITHSVGTGFVIPAGQRSDLITDGMTVLPRITYLDSVSLNALSVTGAISGSGAGITNLNASNITTGTIANARTTGTSGNTGNALVLRDGSGNFSAGTITASLNGNASTATSASSANTANTAVNLSTNRNNWSSNGTITAVVGQLAWKNFGNGHTIFDASQSTSPDGGGVNNANAQIAWTNSYPTLMGWNGANTYGVRVDSARRADSAATVDNGVFNNGGTYSINITGNAEAVDGFSASQSILGNHIVVRDGNGYIFGNYINMSDDGNPGGGAGGITSFITKQGDNFYRSVSVTNASNRIRDGASGTWPINITGNAATASNGGVTSVNGQTGAVTVARGLGDGQSWQDVTASRSSGVTYTNNTGRPIVFMVTARRDDNVGNNGSISLFVNGVNLGGHIFANVAQASAIVPSGQTYRAEIVHFLERWVELR